MIEVGGEDESGCGFVGMRLRRWAIGMGVRLFDVWEVEVMNVGKWSCLSIGRPSGRSKSNQPGSGADALEVRTRAKRVPNQELTK